MSGDVFYWKMRDGNLISIDDMDTNHLRNALKMIFRNIKNSRAKKQDFELHGDMAQAFNDAQEERGYYPEDESFLGI